jgi:uncharacterized protein (DUF362 family)
MSVVSIVKAKGNSEDQVAAAVREAVELAGGLKGVVKPGNTVLINPNLVAPPAARLTGAITRWEVCKAIADIVKELGAKPIIAESAAAGVDTEKVIVAGEYDKLREKGYEVVDLKKTPRAKIPVNNGEIIQEMDTWELVANADAIISVPVLKTHDQTEVTLGIKNLKGLIHDNQKKELHRLGVLDGVVDIIQTVKPVFSIIDGTVAQEGLGPIFGEPVDMGIIVASKDIVACDAVGSILMGYEVEDVLITKFAYERGMGEMNLEKIEVRGEPIDSIKRRFKRSSEVEIEGLPPHELIFDESACTGCKNTVLSAIMDMKNDKKEGYLEGKTIIAGPYEKVPEGVKKEDLILIGKCAKHLKDYGTFVPGCPPNNVYIVRAVVGDREKVERRYATEEGADS